MNAEPDISFNAGRPQASPFEPQAQAPSEPYLADRGAQYAGDVDRDSLAEVWDYLSKH